MTQTILYSLIGLLSSFSLFSEKTNPPAGENYTCSALNWVSPGAIGADQHYRGAVAVTCDFLALSGGGYPQLEAYLHQEVKLEATQINSGPTPGTFSGLPATSYDFVTKLDFSGTSVHAHEMGTIATDRKTVLISLLSTKGIQGSAFDQFINVFDFQFRVTPIATQTCRYHAELNVQIDVTKPWYVPANTLRDQVQKALEGAVSNYQKDLIFKLETNL